MTKKALLELCASGTIFHSFKFCYIV
uniref:Uncharacterized protein n=1 Tax=Lepeophtheirus salmonis TaxID=72036 RepID=A0A0K2T3Z2_LEPSM